MRTHAPVSVFFRLFMLLTILAAARVMSPVPAGAQAPEATQTITVIGTSGVYGDRIAEARQAAISNSLISAVKANAAELLSTEDLVTHFPTLNRILFEQTGTFVQGYKVLTEFKYGKRYRVLVQATVLTDRVIKELNSVGILMDQKYLPKILFLLTETIPGNAYPQYWWGGEDSSFLVTAGEQAMRGVLGKEGFSLIGHSFMKPGPEIASLYHKPYLTDAESAEIGGLLQADVVVVGTSETQSTLNTMGESLRSYKATVTVRAVRTTTGERIAEAAQTAMAVNADETAGGRIAIGSAGKLAAEELVRQITAVWKKERGGPEMVEVVLTGTRHLAGFVKLRKIISATPGVNGIQVREISGDQATVVVDFDSSADELANMLILNDFKDFGISITGITDNTLSIGIVQQEAAPETPVEPAEGDTPTETSD